MKKLSPLNKLLFIINSLVAAVLLVAYLSYFIAPNTITLISLISLAIPVLILLNFLFLIYWLIQFKKQLLLPLITLLIGFQYVTKFYQLNNKEVLLNSDTKIMSYNVRLFNLYDWLNEEDVDKKIVAFINKKKPDILCIQEFHPDNNLDLDYPYSYIQIRNKKNQFGHAIFSNYKIINSGSLDFSNSSNNAIFIDVLKEKDTLRVYNVHLESLKIKPPKKGFEINSEVSEHFKKRVESAFVTQTNQVNLLKANMDKIKHKSVICGDFNNTAFSWVYAELKEKKQDAFEV
ncbi:MAG TPA: endonuclease/exonuclease/phosphatase family protein, partial [Flavobacteriaceae bacterium]|nr:endonuclease/exonuclease/phosphatase family protein [Flavobacteriaceae bacterium]